MTGMRLVLMITVGVLALFAILWSALTILPSRDVRVFLDPLFASD